jgi:hypothetical protein
MARPITYQQNSRSHLGLRFDKHLLQLFDKVVRKHGINRLQALEFLIINSVMEDQIPPRHRGIDVLLEELKAADSQNVVRESKPEQKGKLVAGKPSKGSSGPIRRGNLVNQ